MQFVNNPFCYSGGKYKLLTQTTSLFPNNINTFYDAFGGAGTMCTHASHLATPRIHTWPADASTLGQPAHRLFGQLNECDARLSLS